MIVCKQFGNIVNIVFVFGIGVLKVVLFYVILKVGIFQVIKVMVLEFVGQNICINVFVFGYIDIEMNYVFWVMFLGECFVKCIFQCCVGVEFDFDGVILLLVLQVLCYMIGSVVMVDGGFLLN